jgi:hypothetical protein
MTYKTLEEMLSSAYHVMGLSTNAEYDLELDYGSYKVLIADINYYMHLGSHYESDTISTTFGKVHLKINNNINFYWKLTIKN